MNLHGIVGPVIAAVNPMRTATIQRSTGYTTNADGRRVPSYAPAQTVTVQVQELSSKDLQMTEGINIQGETKKIYMNGDWNGVVRSDGRGGDLITIGRRVYLVSKVLENWEGRRGWTAVMATLQTP